MPEAPRRRSAKTRQEGEVDRPGRFLTRSGSSFIFQLRIPADILGTGPARVLRLSLGPLGAREARLQADLLAVHARHLFDVIRNARAGMDETEETPRGVLKIGDLELSAGSQEELVTEVRGYLKTMQHVVSWPAPAVTPAQATMYEGVRGLVGIAREIAKGEAGNPVITENVELLKGRYVGKLAGETALSPAQEPETVQAKPAAPVPTAPVPPTVTVSPAKMTPPVVEPLLHDPSTPPNVPVPAFHLDRRVVERAAFTKPLLSVHAGEYFAAREITVGKQNKDIGVARVRFQLFIDLIGDHPIDTYNGADLQAFIALLKYWPASIKERPEGMTAREVIAANLDLSKKPLGIKTLQEGYVATVKAIVRHDLSSMDMPDPFAAAKLRYPNTATPSQKSEPLGGAQVTRIFQAGVSGGLLDEAVLPLLGYLSGRRLGLLLHLRGSDFRKKYDGIWVAQTGGIIKVDGIWTRVPIKTDASMTFFVLHEKLEEIGFIDWAVKQGENFLFPELTRLADPSKSASQYMGRLFEKAGVKTKRIEVFHSLRHGNIESMRDNKVDARDRKLQVGHALEEEHDLYGYEAISEARAKEIARMPLPEGVDFSMFEGLNFDELAKGKRNLGRRRKQ